MKKLWKHISVVNMILEVRDIVAGYGPVEILHGVFMHVNEKSIVSIIGPNGAGKSTLLKTIIGFIKPSRGSIHFNGEDITGSKVHDMMTKGLAYVPQGRNVFPRMTVKENLEMGAFSLKSDDLVRKRMEIVFQYFPVLKDKEKQKAGDLSGGQQQMLEIGMALMVDPKLILFDEPSLGLAPKVSKAVFEEIKRLNETGKTLLIVEQNAFRALQISDWAYVLDLGEKKFENTGSNLLKNEKVRKMYLGG